MLRSWIGAFKAQLKNNIPCKKVLLSPRITLSDSY